MSSPTEPYRIDVDDDGAWHVHHSDGRKIPCGDRRDALLILACLKNASDPEKEFARILREAELPRQS